MENELCRHLGVSDLVSDKVVFLHLVRWAQSVFSHSPPPIFLPPHFNVETTLYILFIIYFPRASIPIRNIKRATY